MTFIAIGTHRDHVEVVTDTLSYTVSGSSLGQGSKVLAIPHLDTIVATQGGTDFGEQAMSITWQIANQVATFDDLLAHLPRELRRLWHDDPATDRLDGRSTVLLVGYSPNAESFTGHGMASDLKDFEPFPLGEVWSIPSPWTCRPNTLVARRLRSHLADVGSQPEEVDLALSSWAKQAPLTRPDGAAEWVDFALKIREQHTTKRPHGGPKTLIAGSLVHTHLERGSVTTKTLHTFDDSPETMLEIFRGTHHPIGQLANCWCGSGEAFIDCHLAPHIGKPCGCLSGRPFRDCCAVREPAVTPQGVASRP